MFKIGAAQRALMMIGQNTKSPKRLMIRNRELTLNQIELLNKPTAIAVPDKGELG
jgi:hypothetical protein